jgi:hypothetical protein
MNNRREVLERVKSFGMTNQIVAGELTQISSDFGIELGHLVSIPSELDATYYPQFPLLVRSEARSMAKHYELFYCLEKSIRVLVAETLEEATHREDWWDSDRIPSNIKQEVHNRIKAEVDSGVTRRSLDELDYTTFGELSQLIVSNWDVFGGPLNSKKAVERVMSSLNSLRNPIAHCSPLAEDEALRLNLAMRDWFRLME